MYWQNSTKFPKGYSWNLHFGGQNLHYFCAKKFTWNIALLLGPLNNFFLRFTGGAAVPTFSSLKITGRPHFWHLHIYLQSQTVSVSYFFILGVYLHFWKVKKKFWNHFGPVFPRSSLEPAHVRLQLSSVLGDRKWIGIYVYTSKDY